MFTPGTRITTKYSHYDADEYIVLSIIVSSDFEDYIIYDPKRNFKKFLYKNLKTNEWYETRYHSVQDVLDKNEQWSIEDALQFLQENKVEVREIG